MGCRIGEEDDDIADSLEHISLNDAEVIGRSETVDSEGRFDGATTVPVHEDNTFETIPRTDGVPDISESEVTNVSAAICNETNAEMESEPNDCSTGENPNTTQENDEEDDVRHHSGSLSTNIHQIRESDDLQTSEEVKSESETCMLNDDNPSIQSGNRNNTADARNNNNEANITPIDHSPNVPSDERTESNTINISTETIPSSEQDAIQPPLANRRARLVNMTPEEVLSLRDRILPIQTRHGPILFLPLKRHAPYTQLGQEDRNLQHILSLFRRSPGMRRCRLKQI